MKLSLILHCVFDSSIAASKPNTDHRINSALIHFSRFATTLTSQIKPNYIYNHSVLKTARDSFSIKVEEYERL